jgi:2-dehydro-3-deoxyglucarate aldolase/4-hydroxy-2-oxoheptanedioate aldolase
VAVGPELYERAVKLGAKFLCPGGDLKVMTLGLRELAKTLQGTALNGAAPAPSAPAPSAPTPSRYP